MIPSVRCVQFKYLNGRDLRAFLGVKFSSRVLPRVKELTFRNSDDDDDYDYDDDVDN